MMFFLGSGESADAGKTESVSFIDATLCFERHPFEAIYCGMYEIRNKLNTTSSDTTTGSQVWTICIVFG